MRQKLTTLERAVARREAGIRQLEQRKCDVREEADRTCAAIDKLIATRRVLLEAMKAGTLTP